MQIFGKKKMEEEDVLCRLCLEANVPEKGRLIRPCLCRGSMNFIHEACLQQMREANNGKWLKRCPTCKHNYQFIKTWFVDIVKNPIMIGFLSLLLIIATILLVAFCLRLCGILLFGVKLSQNLFALSSKLIWWSIVLVGAITMLIMIVKSEDGIQQIQPIFIDPQLFNTFAFEIFGYGFSCTGFVVFIVSIYNAVAQKIEHEVSKFAAVIVEVQ
jgi:hypothetical protein